MATSNAQVKQPPEDEFKELKARCKLIFDADPDQWYHTYFSLRRYLRAFGNVDDAFKAILKTNKWRREFGVATLSDDDVVIKSQIAVLCRHRDMHGRPIVYIPDWSCRHRAIV